MLLCVFILCGRRKESAAVCVMPQQHRLKLTQQRRQNKNIAKIITHNQSNIINDYDYEYKRMSTVSNINQFLYTTKSRHIFR